MRHGVRIAGFAIVLAFAATSAMAQKPAQWSEQELLSAAPFCPDTQGFKYGDSHFNTSPRAPYWVGLFGNGFWHMHHYCWAKINLQRKRSLPAAQRAGQMAGVIGDLEYVINNTDPSFVFLPEIHTRIGQAELLRDDPARASEAYARARKLRPDYAPAYYEWADYLMAQKRTDSAMALLREGLAHNPSSAALRERYRRLGGNPAQVAAKTPAPSTPGAAASASGAEASRRAGSGEASAVAADAASAAASGVSR